MKVYLSVDIEGAAGIAHWDEARKPERDYPEFQERMTGEAVAACEGALAAGATEIWIKDAHGSGRNILQERLPTEAVLIRGWSAHPLGMLQELDETFAAVGMVGYHSPASSSGNPLAHTLTGLYAKMMINGAVVSEYALHTYAANMLGVPVAFLSGDETICRLGKELNPSLTTVATNKGVGESVIATHPQRARDGIREGVLEAFSGDLSRHRVQLPDHFDFRLQFKHHADAYRRSFYPGAWLEGEDTVAFSTDDYFEILRLIRFMS